MDNFRLLLTRYRISILVFLASSILILVLTALAGSPVDFSKPEQRLSFAQLLVETLGLLALVIAVLEFSRQLATPELEVWATFVNQSGELQTSSDLIEYHQYDFILDKRFVFHANFSLFIANRGPVPAQFVHVNIKLSNDPTKQTAPWNPAISPHLYLGQEKNWTGMKEEHNWLPVIERFMGDSDFVLHTDTKPVPKLAKNTDEWHGLAGFGVVTSGEGRNWDNAKMTIRCTSQCLNTRELVKEFHLIIPDGLVKG